MGQFAGDYKNPVFITVLGVELKLNPISRLILDAWRIGYLKRNPEPVPPKRVAKDEAKTEYLDDKNPDFQEAHRKWDTDITQAMLSFLIEYGVQGEPPENWKSRFPDDFHEEDKSPKRRWISECCFDEDLDLNSANSIFTAILGLNTVTSLGLVEAQKKLEIKVNDISIWNIRLPTGKSNRQVTMSLEAELYLAARFAGYTWSHFLELPGDPRWCGEAQDSQSQVLAMYQAHNKLEALQWIK